MQMQNTINV